MRTVESVDEDIDCLALGGMNNGVLGLRKSTASMSSAMSVSSDQMSTGKGMDETDTFSYPLTPPLTLPSHVPTGGDLDNESTVTYRLSDTPLPFSYPLIPPLTLLISSYTPLTLLIPSYTPLTLLVHLLPPPPGLVLAINYFAIFKFLFHFLKCCHP